MQLYSLFLLMAIVTVLSPGPGLIMTLTHGLGDVVACFSRHLGGQGVEGPVCAIWAEPCDGCIGVGNGVV